MRLKNVKKNIDSKMDLLIPEELYIALKECKIPDILKVGDKFQQTFNGGLIFEILDIDHEKNCCKVSVTNPLNHFQHIEDWDDLHTVYQALDIKEYKLI